MTRSDAAMASRRQGAIGRATRNVGEGTHLTRARANAEFIWLRSSERVRHSSQAERWSSRSGGFSPAYSARAASSQCILRLLRLSPERAQFLAGAEEPRLDRADRDLQRFGDVRVGHALDVAEHHDRPELVRELPEQLLQRGEGGGVFFGRRRRGRFDLREGVGVGERPTLAGPEGFVHRDPVQPGEEPRFPAELRQVCVRFEKDLLSDILALRGAPKDPSDHPIDGDLVAGHQLAEGLAASAFGPADQFGFRHRLPVRNWISGCIHYSYYSANFSSPSMTRRP